MTTIENSKFVSSYHIKKHDSGIIELGLNLHHKAFAIYQQSDTEYLIDNSIDLGHLDDVVCVDGFPISEIIIIPEITKLFDTDNFIRYHQSKSRNKEQHHFFWIPISLIGRKHLQGK